MSAGNPIYEDRHQSADSLLGAIGEYAAESRKRISVVLMSSREDLGEFMRRWQRMPYKADVTVCQSGFLVDVEKNNSHLLRVRIVKFPGYPYVYAAISDSGGGPFTEFTKFINKHFPHISRIFLTDSDMRRIFDHLSQQGYGVDITYSSRKTRPTAGKKESLVTRGIKPYVEFFDETCDNDQAIYMIGYEASKKNSQSEQGKFKGSISRDCRMMVQDNFFLLRGIMMPTLLQLVSQRNEHLKASAESAQNKEPEPVILKFTKDVFEDRKNNASHLKVLASLPSASISTYHSNPYIRTSMVDYLYGSSYDIWVLTSNEMAIVPQVSATSASLERLVNHVFERISSGTVKKYETELEA